MKTLKDVPIGKSAKVVKLHSEGALRRRIMDMGITRGTTITIRKVAPLGDPLEITLRDNDLLACLINNVETVYYVREAT